MKPTPIQRVPKGGTFWTTVIGDGVNIGSLSDIVRQIIAQVWRLVVGCVLPGDSETIGMVMHQSRHPDISLVGRRIDIQRSIVILAPEDHLLTPVAEDV